MNDRTSADPPAWWALLTAEEQSRIETAGFGRRVGFGGKAAVLVIDAQNYMVGDPRDKSGHYPSACPGAPEAVQRIADLLEAARHAGALVIYTRFVLKRDGSDAGVYIRKRDLLDMDGWCLEGTHGAAVVHTLEPKDGDIVMVKKKPSAFIGTPLLGMLIDRHVDTVIVTGGSTSNCVRATAVDAASYNFRTIVPYDCVFDRFAVSHQVALFDIDRQYGDVVTSEDVVQYFARHKSDD
jgi:nicotinamidase-related amidase